MDTAVHEKRKAALEAELARVLPLLIDEYGAKKIILFGSLATGEIGEWSDLDLVVIKDTRKRFFDRLQEIIDVASPRIGNDILVYTPAEFEELCQKRRFFREEVVGKGTVLYAK